jgi:hypothetical protein
MASPATIREGSLGLGRGQQSRGFRSGRGLRGGRKLNMVSLNGMGEHALAALLWAGEHASATLLRGQNPVNKTRNELIGSII